MSSLFDLDTSEKLISSIAGGIAIIAAVIGWLRRSRKNASREEPPTSTNSNVNNININVGNKPDVGPMAGAAADMLDRSVQSLKRNANILFVDDDKEFKMFNILRKMGWEHTRQIVDVSSLEAPTLVEAHIVFVDIQGVGKAMHYKDEGLGLALAIKRRHPAKGVVIYSAEEHGARFHDALQEADAALPKTAEPIRFENTIVKVLSK